jgi:MoaA/NifB/PqqE/SkfB family radical SAM enzyme
VYTIFCDLRIPLLIKMRLTMFKRLRQTFQRKARRPYRLLQIEPSLECTLDCVMCPWSELRPQEATMTWETFMRIAPNLSLAESVDFTGGGEPLKNPRLVEMVRIARQAGCEVGFSTNGMRLYPEVSRQLIDLGLDWISFSVDAASAGLYESIRRGARYQDVIENIAAMRDLKQRMTSRTPRMLMVFVMMVGEQANYFELPAFVQLAHRLGIEQVIAKNLDVILKDGDDERRFFSHEGEPAVEIEAAMAEARRSAQYSGLGLRFYNMRPQEVTVCEQNPLQNVFFNWEGIISPCITLSYAENRVFDGQRVLAPCQRFGDIHSETLQDVWDKPAYREFRNYYETRLAMDRQVTLDRLLGGPTDSEYALPPAPEGCRTCYYLYGI